MLIKMGKKMGKIVDEVLRLAGDTGHFLMIRKGNGSELATKVINLWT